MSINFQNFTQSEVDEKLVINVFEKAVDTLGIKDKDVAVVLVGDNRIRNLNKRYRGKNKVTDVLSFGTNGGNEELGDIVICVPRAKKQARQAGHSFEKELATLLVHGFLHLVGHNHEKDEEAEEMERLEDRILHTIDIS